MRSMLKNIWKADHHWAGMFLSVVFNFILGGALIFILILYLSFGEYQGKPDVEGVRWWYFARLSLYLCVAYLPYTLLVVFSYRAKSFGAAKIGLVGMIMTLGCHLVVGLIVFNTDMLGTGSLTDEQKAVLHEMEEDCQCNVRIGFDPNLGEESDSRNLPLMLNYNNSKINQCLMIEDTLLKKSRRYCEKISSNFGASQAYTILTVTFYASDFGYRSESPYCSRSYTYNLKTNELIEKSESGRRTRIKRQIEEGYVE